MYMKIQTHYRHCVDNAYLSLKGIVHRALREFRLNHFTTDLDKACNILILNLFLVK